MGFLSNMMSASTESEFHMSGKGVYVFNTTLNNFSLLGFQVVICIWSYIFDLVTLPMPFFPISHIWCRGARKWSPEWLPSIKMNENVILTTFITKDQGFSSIPRRERWYWNFPCKVLSIPMMSAPMEGVFRMANEVEIESKTCPYIFLAKGFR